MTDKERREQELLNSSNTVFNDALWKSVRWKPLRWYVYFMFEK
jgi:hypothetical protein